MALSRPERQQAKWTGVAIGLVLSLWVLVYLPMKANYDQCGTVTLCPAE